MPCASCDQSTVTTNDASVTGTTSASLRGTYKSTIPLTTYFEYKKVSSILVLPTTVNKLTAPNVNPSILGNTLSQTLNTGLSTSSSFLNSNYLNSSLLAPNTSIAPSLLNSNPSPTSFSAQNLNNINSGSLNATLLTPNTNLITSIPLSQWKRVGDLSHGTNTFGTVTFPLTGLAPNTKYDFVFKAETNNGTQFSGDVLSFKTNSSGGGGGLTDTTVTPTVNTNYPPSGTGTYTGGSSGTTTGTTTPVTGSTTVPNVGTIATPPGDATVHYHEGIETVFARQIVANKELAKIYGYVEGTDLTSFSWTLADFLAKNFGYVSPSGKEIRVSEPDVAAYQLQMVGNKLYVYEYYYSRIIKVQNLTSTFRTASGYEYYFQK